MIESMGTESGKPKAKVYISRNQKQESLCFSLLF
jgi:hypothetical protein